MKRSKIVGTALAGLGAVAVPLGIAVGGAAPAAADPRLCVSDPLGIAYGCVDAPGWVDYDGPRYFYGGDDDDDDD